MTFLRAAVVVAALVLAFGLPTKSQATAYFSFGYYGPGITFYGGHYPYYYYPYYYRPYPYYYGYRYRYHRPYRYRRYYKRRYAGRCSRWRSRCAANWGYGGSNYRGCLRYHRCR